MKIIGRKKAVSKKVDHVILIDHKNLMSEVCQVENNKEPIK